TPVYTGFLLAHPRLIVCDGYEGNTNWVIERVDGHEQVRVIGSDGRCLPARVLHHERSAPFGPLLVEAPEDLKVPGPLPAASAPASRCASGSRSAIGSDSPRGGSSTRPNSASGSNRSGRSITWSPSRASWRRAPAAPRWSTARWLCEDTSSPGAWTARPPSCT